MKSAPQQRSISFDLYKITFSYLMINTLFLPAFSYGIYLTGFITEYVIFIGICCIFLLACNATSNPARKKEMKAWLSARLAQPHLFFTPATVTDLEKQAVKDVK